MIITEKMVREAIELVNPAAEAILVAEGATWGPHWVEGFVNVPGLPDIPFLFGRKTEWNPEWGKELDFISIAKAKLWVAKRLRMNTSVVAVTCPWLLLPGEYLYPGGAYRDGIVCGVSGAKGRVDEALAEMVVSIIIMLAQLETDRRIAAKKMQI